MNKINGRIDLFYLIKNLKIKMKEAKECSTKAYWLYDINGKNYLFKTYQSTNQMYRSLIIEKIAIKSGINFAHTELASFDTLDGELIENYKKESYDYLNGSTILEEYFLYLKEQEQEKMKQLFPKYKSYRYTLDEILLNMNNLETIEEALFYHYRTWENKEQIVKNIMEKLKHIFYLDFLTMQRDRGHNNWELEEKKNILYADLPPLIDSNRSFYLPSFQILLNPTYKMSPTSLYEKLEYMLDYDENNDFFLQLYTENPPEKIEKIIKEIELEHQFLMEKEIKILIMASYNEHYQILTKILEKRRKKQI